MVPQPSFSKAGTKANLVARLYLANFWVFINLLPKMKIK